MYNAFLSAYWLAKEEIANGKFTSLLKLEEILGVPEIQCFEHRSQGSQRESFLLLGQVLKNDVLTKVKAANSYGLLVEKSTSANADTLVKLITDELTTNELDIKKLGSLASDGASVMTGSRNGVAAKLRELVPTLINIHCICYRLSLACNDANDQLKCISDVETVLHQLWSFFENSAQDQLPMSKLLLK